MQNRKPNHHDDMSVVELKKHHSELHQAEMMVQLQSMFGGGEDTFESALQGMMLDADLEDVHTVIKARQDNLNKVLDAKKDQERNVAGNKARYARGESQYGLFSTVAARSASNSSTEEVSSLEVSPTLSPKM